MDFDALLNYEDECFQDGFARGQQQGVTQGHTEGRELGIHTGYQKFLSMGVLQARIKHWQELLAEDQIGEKQRPAIEALAKAIDTPTLENTLEGVEEFDRRVKLAKNKCRVLASSTETPPVDAHEQKIMYQRGADDAGAIEDMY